jgi:hypothetical protein
MPDETPQPPILENFVPKELIDLIGDRIKAGVSDAEGKFGLNAKEEDALTGALGHAISTPRPMTLQSPQGTFVYEIRSFKLRGRGPEAPEKRLGADAIFQVAVSAGGRMVFLRVSRFRQKQEEDTETQRCKVRLGHCNSTSKRGLL